MTAPISAQLFLWAFVTAFAVSPVQATAACGDTLQHEPRGATAGRVAATFALSRDRHTLAVAINDADYGGVFVYALPTGKALWNSKISTEVSALAVSPDGALVAVAYRVRARGCPHIELRRAVDGTAAVELEDRSGLSSVTGESAAAVTFNYDGTLIAGALRNAVRVWSISGENRSTAQPPGFDTRAGVDAVREIAFAPDAQTIAGIGTNKPLVYKWRLADGRLTQTFAIGRKLGEPSNPVFNTGASSLAVASSVGPAVVFRQDGTKACEIKGTKSGALVPLAFHDKGTLWVAGGAGLERWACSTQPKRLDVIPISIVPDTIIPVEHEGFVAISVGDEWRSDPLASASMHIVDVRSGAAIANILLPGRSASANAR